MADRTGHQLGKYRLTRLLGQGSFAEVYLGVHLHLGTEAAIKLLHTHLASEEDVEQFRREARTLATLIHPHIVRVLDFDVEAGTPYLVLDYAPHGSLRQQIPAGAPLAPAAVLPLLMQVAAGLQYAHDQHLIHRDIKPENLLVGRHHDLLLTDFGIAVIAQSTNYQQTRGVAGTPAYMAPEQLQGKPRPASDLYALGVVVYEWLAGERPFQGSLTEVVLQHLSLQPPSLRGKVPDLSPAVEQVVLTALAKDPHERFGSVRAFVNAFAQASQGGSTIPWRSAPLMPPASPDAPVITGPGHQPGITVPASSQLTPPAAPYKTLQVSAPAAPEVLGTPLRPSLLLAPTRQIAPTIATALPPGGNMSARPDTSLCQEMPTIAEGQQRGGSGPHRSASPAAQASARSPSLPAGWGGQATPTGEAGPTRAKKVSGMPGAEQ